MTRRPEHDAEDLLANAPWVRRLARRLVGDAHLAEDVAQDALAAAWARGEGFGGRVRMRRWLAGATRNLAWRARAQEDERRAREARAARSEAGGGEEAAAERLRVHRRLVDLVLSLEEPYREALVLRYFDDLAPREIAARLGVSREAARQRVSRGLAMLRARLDAEEWLDEDGTRRHWAVALAPLLAPPRSSPPTPAPAGSGLALLAIMTPKMLLALLAAAAVVALVLVVRALDPVAEGGAEPAVAEAPAELESGSGRTEEEGGGVVAVERDTRRVAAAGAAPRTPRVRVVREDGGPLDEVGVAWIDAGLRVHELELDAEGGAPRPEGSTGARFHAWAPGCAEAHVREEDAETDVVLRLPRERVLRGRLVEDGGPPVRPVRLSTHMSNEHRGIGYEERHLEVELEDLGALREESPYCWTRPDGSFEVRGLPRGASGSIQLPTTHRAVLDGVPTDESHVSYAEEQRELVIETVLLPHVFGRLVWEDDGSPVVGSLWVVYERREARSSFMAYDWTHEDGRFALGLPVSDRALRLPPEERGEVVIHRAIRFGVDDANGVPRAFERRVDLDAAVFPLDLGVVQVPRAAEHPVRVVERDGAPVEGAVLASSLDRTRTDAGGRARLACGEADEIGVLAPGYSFARHPVSSSGEQEIELEPGSTLLVRILPEEPAGPAPLHAGLVWEESPFEGAHLRGEPPFSPMPYRVHYGYHGREMSVRHWNHARPGAPGEVSFRIPHGGELVVPGLRAGSSFHVRIVDGLVQPLAERAVAMPREPGVHVLELEGVERVCRLRARLVDGEGRPVGDGSVRVSGEGGSKWFPVGAGLLDVRPLAAGTYSLITQFPGYLPRSVPAHELTPDSGVLELSLERARPLELRLVDASGQPLVARSVRLRGPDGWSYARRDPPSGLVSFRRAPIAPLEATIVVGTRTYTETIEAEVEEAEIALPAHGGLRVVVAEPPPLTRKDGLLRLLVREPSGEGSLELRLSYSRDGAGPFTLETDLLPGDYALELDLLEHTENAREGDEPLVRPLERREVTVTAGETRRVDAGG